MSLPVFAFRPAQRPLDARERERILANPGFGEYLTDHMVSIDYHEEDPGDGEWFNARVEPYGPILMDPAAAVLHYGQEIFEGIKAFRHPDGTVWAFRPEQNALRFNRSAYRMALPLLPERLFLRSLEELLRRDAAWVPKGEGQALYLRPFMYASEKFLGVRPARQFAFKVIASPVGSYFGTLKPVRIWLSEKYARAAKGGTGEAKCGGNYAASLRAQLEAQEHDCEQVVFTDPHRDHAIEELGGMNIFFVFRNGVIVTPVLSGSILAGITRASIIELARDRGFTVEERTITLREWKERTENGDITEVFACGTAAVISPIGQLVTSEGTYGAIDRPAGEVTTSLYHQLVGLQTGKIEDAYGWMTQLA